MTAAVPEERFRLAVRPPVRALAIASIVALVGAILFVLSASNRWGSVAMGIGLTVMLLGVLLAVSALVLARRLRCTLLLGADTLTVVRAGGQAQLRWDAVEEVVQDGRRLYVEERTGRRVTIVEPPGSPRAIFDAAVEAIRRRLDANRGVS